MNQDNRVLGRQGARELTPRELEYVAGAVHTLTVCTLAVTASDGDANECQPLP
jgi:hypothetical protein